MESTPLDDIFDDLPLDPERHERIRPSWRLMNRVSRIAVAELFDGVDRIKGSFGPFGEIDFPYHRMGKIDALDLFGLDELIIFAFYWVNRARYRRAVDFGANLGLHTVVMGRCGFDVRSFEPDPEHFGILVDSLARNGVASDLHQSAVSTEDGHHEFVRVLGNTTGSHLSGAKADPYGELERFEVTMENAEPHLRWADLAKIDIEGHEAALLQGLSLDIWRETDAIMEVGTAENAALVFERFKGSPVNLFSQKKGWNRVEALDDMPTSHRDGSLFVSHRSEMPWA